jgi:hypothetical protein
MIARCHESLADVLVKGQAREIAASLSYSQRLAISYSDAAN